MGLLSLIARPPVVKWMRKRYAVRDRRLHQQLWGLDFQNPVGLAAGFDKDARWFHQLPGLGFSHVEVGTLTGQPQPGNPQPRLFRLPADQAIINRMGFNNRGADQAARRLARVPKASVEDVLGVNIGKTKVVPLAEANQDYCRSFERLFDYADYFTINVSSPNTPGLRELQGRDHLLALLDSVGQLNERLAADHEVAPKPVLLKIAPDLENHHLDDIAAIAGNAKIDGIVATNTTISRQGLNTPAAVVQQIGDGGLSGRPLTERSRNVVRYLYERLPKEMPIIGVGGIMNGHDAWNMVQAGATLLQIYTGFIYGGPGVVREINRYLLKKLDEHRLDSIRDAIGKQWD